MSLAIMYYLETQRQVSTIVQKFGTPGHSSIQEVDNLHSQIEKTLSHSEVFTPIGLLRILKLVNRKNPLKIIQMREQDFLDFQLPAKSLKFSQIPYTRIREIIYRKGDTHMTVVIYKEFGLKTLLPSTLDARKHQGSRRRAALWRCYQQSKCQEACVLQ